LVIVPTLLLAGFFHGFGTARLPAQEVNWSYRAFHFAGDAPDEVLSVKPMEKAKAYSFADLPLVVTTPLVVENGGLHFPVTTEGLYRFVNLSSKQTRHTIRYGGDLWRFVGSLSRLQVHGWRHNGEGMAALTERARKGRLSIHCGVTVDFVRHHASIQGIRCRQVMAYTRESANGYDDGHTLVELFDPTEKRWLLYDADVGCRFKAKGRYLNLGEAVQAYRSGARPELDFLRKPAIDTYAEAAAPVEFAQYSLLFESIVRDVGATHKWYARVLQVPSIGSVTADRAEDWDNFMKSSYGR
jgi:hypothetical protein